MNTAKLLLIAAAFTVSATAQVQTQTSVQAGGSAASAAGVQAGQSQGEAPNQTSAQTSLSATSGQPSQINGGLAFGTTVNAKLDKPLDSKTTKPGDVVTARTLEPVKSNGNVVLPKGTKLIGHVTQASARAKGDSQSALGITFDRAVLKNGREVPVNLGIQAMASGQAAEQAEFDQMNAVDSAREGVAATGMAQGRGTPGALAGTTGAGLSSVTGASAGLGSPRLSPVSSTLDSTTGLTGPSVSSIGGLDSAGRLTSTSHGMFGLRGLSLNSGMADGTQGSFITSAGKNVHLDSGTRMLMVTQAGTSASRRR